MHQRPSGHVSLLTDFGAADPYVGVVKGALLQAHPKAVDVDLGHAVPPQDIAGAFWWRAAIGWFPPGTVHVGIVDPGVGTARGWVAVAAHECYWLAPDNGLVTHVLASAPSADVRSLDIEHLGVRPASRTFHGRDVLAKVAAWLAAGRYGFSALGPRLATPVLLPPLLAGPRRVVHVDHYGNLVTNVPAAALAGCAAVAVGGRRAVVVGTYGEAPAGSLVALVGSTELVEVAVVGGSAAGLLGAGAGAAVELLPA
jgi:S-adenosylmethionine hydrolase